MSTVPLIDRLRMQFANSFVGFHSFVFTKEKIDFNNLEELLIKGYALRCLQGQQAADIAIAIMKEGSVYGVILIDAKNHANGLNSSSKAEAAKNFDTLLKKHSHLHVIAVVFNIGKTAPSKYEAVQLHFKNHTLIFCDGDFHVQDSHSKDVLTTLTLKIKETARTATVSSGPQHT